MLLTFFQTHGLAGAIALLMVALAIYNIAMTAVAQVFLVLHKQEPPWAVTAGAWGVKIAQWLSANVPVATPAQNQKTLESAESAVPATPEKG
jgi:hypothetical protein